MNIVPYKKQNKTKQNKKQNKTKQTNKQNKTHMELNALNFQKPW